MERCSRLHVSSLQTESVGEEQSLMCLVPHSQIGVMTKSGNAAGDPTAEAGDRLGRELRDSWASTSGYPELSVYVNYAHGDETLRQRYADRKLARLAALKRKWDPDIVFAYNNALPTTYPS